MMNGLVGMLAVNLIQHRHIYTYAHAQSNNLVPMILSPKGKNKDTIIF